MNKNIYLIIAAALSLLIGAHINIPLAAWLAPIFILRFFRDCDKAGRNFLLLWVISAVTSVISWRGATFFPSIIEIAFFFAFAPLTLLPYVIDRLYYRRFPNSVWVTLVFPISATAMDFFSASGSPFGSFGAIAYTQHGFTPVMQIASVTGLWGITFVMNWFATLANHLWDSGFKFTRLSLTLSCLLAFILSLSFMRTLLPAQPEQTAIIAGFSLPEGTLPRYIGQFKGGDEAGFRQAVDELNVRQLEQIRRLADEGANIVVLQEGAGMGLTDQVEKLINDAGVIAKEKNIYIVLPTFDFGKTPAVNSVHIIDPNGKVVLSHIKYGGNMFEGTQKGDGILQTVDTPYGQLSAVICWDADFPAVIKQAGSQNVDLLFVPANDWKAVRDVHSGMATFRSVENGLTIFRQTGQGVSLVSDMYGNIINRVDTFEESTGEFAGIQKVSTPIGSVNTLYPQIGDLFGNTMLICLLGLFIGLLIIRKKVESLA